MKKIYLSTVALEKNRWSKDKAPSFNVSDFIPKLKDDGFYGLELWEYHYTLTNDEEKDKLCNSGIPFYFNSYISIEKRDDEQFKIIGDAVKNLGATAVKFNFSRNWGENIPEISTQLDNLKRLTEFMPDNVKMLCECHPNTLMEVPEDAGEIFAKLDKEKYGAIIHLETDNAFADRCFDCYGERICHIHCQYKGNSKGFQSMDDGSGKAKQLVEYYKSKGFNGTMALEFVKFEDSAEAHYENAKKEVKYLKSICK